jgi:asparagine synthase (glutamine-hydrolysing)
MCGFAGWVGLGVPLEERAHLLRQMTSTITHRGPDDHGAYIDEHVGLGFQRLSIVDLVGGHQPMSSANGQAVITFNGEIFNHAELRDELTRIGRQFRTRSDTEVILQLYEQFGIDGLVRLNGMFAIVIWDKARRTIHLVRDRLGVKPLYYAIVGDALLFGSEIKAILASDRIVKSVNRRAVWDYLTYRYVPAPQTIWNGIFKLPPAHRLDFRLDASGPRVSRWWDMPMAAPTLPRSDLEYEEEFRYLFENAVSLRLQADVPVGITLSGGLDSSAVVAAASDSSLHTFSVAFANSPDTDELMYARMVSEHYATTHHEIVIDENDFLGFLPEFVWYTDEPLGDLASVPLYYVLKLAKSHVKVVLSGEGADEVLAGYNFEVWAKSWDQSLGAKKRAFGLMKKMSSLAAPFLTAARRQMELVAMVTDQRLQSEPLSMTNFWSSAEKREMLKSAAAWPDSLDCVRDDLNRIGAQPPLNQVLYAYCQDWLVEDLLMKADRMSMANSLELRTPFLDYRLVEWAGRLPLHLKAGPNAEGEYRTKQILRSYAEPRLPRAIVQRPKQGFPVPVYGWLSGRLAPWARETLLNPAAYLADWLRPESLEQIVSLGTSPEANSMARHRLWNLLILEIWMRRWMA